MTNSQHIRELSEFPALSGVPYEQLSWLVSNSLHRELKHGEILSSPESPLTGTHFIMTGSCQVYNFQQGAERELGTLKSGEITGYLPFSRGYTTSVHISAMEPTAVLTLPIQLIKGMISEYYELTQALVHVMCNRIRYMTSVQLQNEKMMALGKLSAGITHEINNPASANISDASNLIGYLKNLSSSFQNLPFCARTKQSTAFYKILGSVQPEPDADIIVSFRERVALEEHFNQWLISNGIENGDEIAESYVELGLTHEPLIEIADAYQKNDLAVVLTWIAAHLQAQRTARNILSSSKRIEQLVHSVKTYTHMDRGAAKQLTNIHSGIKNALIMLEHKRKHLNINLVEDYDTSLPEVHALVGELNQVWTNLIDNALDAMAKNGSGTLTIRTVKDQKYIKIIVKDNGPGIPEEIQSLIFDPFFTTKEIGKGTGIGLEVVKTIIAQHSGTVKMTSHPGETSFIICFPIYN
ncbi:ATP-binding protein [Mucilaginibacter psychrotolerans]|uniref:histidine kinase n=1 Tax=Mucilaginibacter psychrotolerans TaxID=1524096 RepID=A0A4Y8SFY2_9SPHI|nr:ATP-binding protein [Mucilaginibacter psychrotolerans]TFF37792.1 cyclic nucleotide-binding domain-containing protein [Mucilaginibacter psychrotolerans]